MKDLPRVSLEVTEEVVSIEICIPDEIIRAAVECICARFCDLGNDSASAEPILSGKVARKNFEFLNGIGIGVIHNAVGQEIVVEAAV